MVRTVLNVFHDPGVNVVLAGPGEPVPMGDFQMNVNQPVHEGRRHGFDNGAVLGPVSGPHNDGPFGQVIIPDPFVLNQTVEGLLHLMGAGIQFI